ncbi:T5orf172 domain-containing protein [Powai lake megavirus]|uniref:T5orf172 domain-containing protein n=1 Tax=Powai lake megavirus TaxID=1842663 RepID=A0A167R0N6_9VIRU|nr:T5orf172 domain-containing protein [Powai lake megavirus]ANB50172.1 T5orf172 domain-containing protein [Powai lake megavirus]
MQSIYIVSTLEKAKKKEYKIGQHTGTQRKLLSRYGTPLIDPIIYFFRPVHNSKKIETLILKKLNKYRIINSSGNKTEWIKLDIDNIIKKVCEIIWKNDLEVDENNLELNENDTKNKIKNNKSNKIKVNIFGTGIDMNEFSVFDINDAVNDYKGACIGLIRLFHFNNNRQKYHNIYTSSRKIDGKACILSKYGLEHIDSIEGVNILLKELIDVIELILSNNKKIECKSELKSVINMITKNTEKIYGFQKECHYKKMEILTQEIIILMYDQKNKVMNTLSNCDDMA